MKHTLDIDSYISYNSYISFFNNLLESDTIETSSDLKSEEKKEFSKWQKVIQWIKSNKTPIIISIGGITILSIIISMYLKILKHEQQRDDEFKKVISDLDDFMKSKSTQETKINIDEFIRQFDTLRVPVKRNDKDKIKIISDFIAQQNLNINDKEHQEYINKFINAINFKIKTGQDIDNWLKDIDNYENALKTDVGVHYDPIHPPLTWKRSDEEWRTQAALYDRINQLQYYVDKLKGDYPPLENILNDMKFGNISKAISGIKMSYFGRERNSKINNLNKLLNFVHDSILNIYKERDGIQKLLN